MVRQAVARGCGTPPTGGSPSHPRGEVVGFRAAARHAGLVLYSPQIAVLFAGECVVELTRIAHPAITCASPAGSARVLHHRQSV